MVALIGASVSANPGSKTDLLVTKDGKVIVAKVKLGLFNIKAKFTDGNKIKVNYSEVTSFIKDGENFTKKPLYDGRKYTGMVFMKLVSWRSGLSLYCYEDASMRSKDNKRYFVFKDENTFWLEVDASNAVNIQKFFNKN
jgi:uncharacterized protein YjdB